MISREQTDDTLKNILTVPISFKRLLTGKLIVCGVPVSYTHLPIGYADLTGSYWQQHLAGAGRIKQ